MGQWVYDSIGVGYREYRRPDPRIATRIIEALGDSKTVLNVGAGVGSYEPEDRHVVAVEPSSLMIRQRGNTKALVVQASAMNLPFRDNSFDASMAILTVHHWPDRATGLAEMKRVTNGHCVVLTWEWPNKAFWLMEDYFPHFLEPERRLFPPWFREDSDVHSVHPIPIPSDCTDGFLCAYWQRPERYLDPQVRRSISTFSRIGNFEPGLARLRDDLANGSWHRRYEHLFALKELDLGYRIVIKR
jgi:SAM-dependent methyltransferase